MNDFARTALRATLALGLSFTANVAPVARVISAQFLDSAAQGEIVPPLNTGVAFHERIPVAMGEDVVGPLDGQSPALARASVQGVVKLNVLVGPERVMAGEPITYTYLYTNTDSVPHSLVIRPTWSNYGLTGDVNLQACQVSACTAASFDGPEPVHSSVPETQFTIASLLPGQSGRFSIVMATNKRAFPVSGKTPKRPAGSAALYLDGNFATLVSDDAASGLFVGPPLNLTKGLIDGQPTDVSIYDVVTFRMRVGNATRPEDAPGGVVRADATNATGIVVYETLPQGSELVAIGPTSFVTAFNPSTNVLAWYTDTLNIGETREFTFSVRKMDVDKTCGTLDNLYYDVGANELPFETPTSRYVIQGQREDGRGPTDRLVRLGVATPLIIQPIEASPDNLLFNDTAALTITVANYWPQTITAATLVYYLQANAFYVPGSATPVPVSAPDGTTTGGVLTWTFSVGAGNPITPTLAKFSLRIKGALFTVPVQRSEAEVSVQSPTVPQACFFARIRNLNFRPRLEVRKYPVDYSKFIGNEYRPEGSQALPFAIEITNKSMVTLTGLVITDVLPFHATLLPNFSYVPGSAKLDGVPLPPNEVINGNGGRIIWRNITARPDAVTTLTYDMFVDGPEFYPFCNGVSSTRPEEMIDVSGLSNKVCTRINPPFELELIGDRTDLPDISTPASREVTYTLRLTNKGTRNYRAALAFYLDRMEYVRQVSSNTGNPILTPDNDLVWQWADPFVPNQSLTAQVVARVPENCPLGTYSTEIGFNWTDRDLREYLVSRLPPLKWNVTCDGGLRYRKLVAASPINLGETVEYTLQLFNTKRSAALNSIIVTDTLPLGFAYTGMAAASNVSAAPAQSILPDGRRQLVWNVATIAANANTRIIYTVRAPLLVGEFQNFAFASSSAGLGKCSDSLISGRCVEETVNGVVVQKTVATVGLDTLATIEPNLTGGSTCAIEGEVRDYRVTLLNTNSHTYRQTTVTMTIPVGVQVLANSGPFGPGEVSYAPNGDLYLTWHNLTLPTKPQGQIYGQLNFTATVAASAAYGSFPLAASATSIDGPILQKDTVATPELPTCVAQSSLAKTANRVTAKQGDSIVYQLSVANASTETLNVRLQDVIPSQLAYAQTLAGPPPTTVSGNTLTWELSIPPATNGVAHYLQIRYSATGTSAQRDARVVNNIQQIGGPTLAGTKRSATVFYNNSRAIHLPMVRR